MDDEKVHCEEENQIQDKCGKEKTAEECIHDFEEFMYKFRFVDFLPPRENDGDDGRDPLWVRFPPERRYNIDQVAIHNAPSVQCRQRRQSPWVV